MGFYKFYRWIEVCMFWPKGLQTYMYWLLGLFNQRFKLLSVFYFSEWLYWICVCFCVESYILIFCEKSWWWPVLRVRRSESIMNNQLSLSCIFVTQSLIRAIPVRTPELWQEIYMYQNQSSFKRVKNWGERVSLRWSPMVHSRLRSRFPPFFTKNFVR